MARPKTVNANGLHPKAQLVVDTLRELHAEGVEKAGPTAIAEAAGPQARLTASLVSTHIKTLVELGVVERLPQGERRAVYRLVDTVEDVAATTSTVTDDDDEGPVFDDDEEEQ